MLTCAAWGLVVVATRQQQQAGGRARTCKLPCWGRQAPTPGGAQGPSNEGLSHTALCGAERAARKPRPTGPSTLPHTYTNAQHRCETFPSTRTSSYAQPPQPTTQCAAPPSAINHSILASRALPHPPTPQLLKRKNGPGPAQGVGLLVRPRVRSPVEAHGGRPRCSLWQEGSGGREGAGAQDQTQVSGGVLSGGVLSGGSGSGKGGWGRHCPARRGQAYRLQKRRAG